ncbi:MAG: ABC transporter ATP-binding protein [Planctomycetes bacterium]|nr:ABC transporter ATP-binding protein [Planctomycetota bacterium]
MKLRAENIVFGYGARPVLDGVTIDVPEGSLVGLVGPNGAGKSTLLKLMYGVLKARSGRVLVDGRELSKLTRREIARLLGVVPQVCNPTFPVNVEQFVGMGRYARERFLGGPAEGDAAVVRRCLAEMGLEGLADRPVDEISGGEFRRVLVAQALAQEPQVLLFDEPVQQLDLLHQLEVMNFARSFARRGGTAAVIVLHDLGLAARFCDTIALLHGGRVLASGRPEDVLTAANVRLAYGVEASIQRCPATGSLQVVPLAASTLVQPVASEGRSS